MINPSLPAVQDTLRGEANKLYDKGVSVIAVSGLTALARPRARHAVAEALPTFALAGLEAHPGAALRAGRTAFAPVSAVSGACVAPTAEDDCPGAMADPGALSTQAFALATRWHHDHIAPLDPGPIHVDGLPRSKARQWATVGAVAGGWYLLGDDATAIEPGALEVFLAPLDAKAVVAAQPVYGDGDTPPSEWMSETTLAVFNWTDAPLTWTISPAATAQFTTMRSVFDAESTVSMDAGLTLDVPPNDVLFFVAAE
jgi:hypothetical protein